MRGTQTIYLHLFFGFICLIGYAYLGIVFKITMIPYVIWMILKKDSCYLPALLIHISSDTMIMPIVLLTCAYLSIKNYRVIKEYKLSRMFNVLLLLSPIFVWSLYAKLNAGISFNDSINSIGMYLSFFGFFYGCLITKTFNKKIFVSLVFCFFVLFLLSILNIHFSRLLFFSYPLLISLISILFFFNKTKYRLIIMLLFLFGSLNIFFSYEITFTLIGSSIFSLILSILYFKQFKVYKFLNIQPYLITLIIMALGLYIYNNDFNDLYYANYKSGSEFTENIQYKFFADRIPFWASSIEYIINKQPILPPIELESISALMLDKNEIEYTFGAHNVYIELVRQFGFIAGIILCVMYVRLSIISSAIFSLKNLNPLFIIMAASSISIVIVGGLTGTFPLMMNFSLAIMSTLGLSYSYYYINKSQ